MKKTINYLSSIMYKKCNMESFDLENINFKNKLYFA